MKYKIRIAFFLFLTLIIGSCVTHRKYPYLQGTNKDTVQFNIQREEYTLQPGDVLDIKVSSNIPSDIEIFNKRFEATNPSNNSNAISNYLYGYLVNGHGNIEIPLIGTLHVTGLTCNQLNDTIQEKLSEFLNYVSVTTKLGVFRITVLGEVFQPGTKEIINQYNVNIYQAIGLAGDATDLANKKKVKLVRKKDGQISVIRLDLSTINMIASEYYYLQPNDVVYVEPLKAKVFRSNASNVTVVLS
ncbi:MAG TPA: polysaccharide biosynthesis/export family protein, partial [Cytophagaceae bacterium]|nr:polysaccharide biosynthesis/export family protein [Cytophagaceae bacterium]